MKAIFSLVALLLVLGVTGLLVKKQLSASSIPAATGVPASTGAAPATPTQQVQQVGQQVQELMQQPRPQAPEQ